MQSVHGHGIALAYAKCSLARVRYGESMMQGTLGLSGPLTGLMVRGSCLHKDGYSVSP